MTDTNKNNPPRKRAIKRSSRANPKVAGLLPLLKDMNRLQATADQKGYEFLSYLLRMAIMEAQSLASGGEREQEGASRDKGGSSCDR